MLIDQKKTQIAFIRMLSDITELQMVLYELRDQKVIYKVTTENYLPYCKLIKDFPDCRDICEKDHTYLLERSFESENYDINLCHAGLYQLVIPIMFKDEMHSLLISEGILIDEDEYLLKSKNRVDDISSKLGLNREQKIKLKSEFRKTKTIKLNELDKIVKSVSNIQSWFYSLIYHQKMSRRESEKVSHKLHTRIQPIMAQAENLYSYAEDMSVDDLKSRLKKIMFSTLALSTIVNNLAQETYFGNYRFRRNVNLRSLIEKSIEIYKPEADGRNIDIQLKYNIPRWNIEMSKEHIQMALNNLINNAIKYSFSGNKNKKRHILIEGSDYAKHYEISFQNYGVGILEEEIRTGAVFNDGYQGKLTKNEYRTGFGKGLFITKKIIGHHHGTIEIQSNLVSTKRENNDVHFLTTLTVRLPYL